MSIESQSNWRNDNGFTLVELIMALVLLGILSTTLYGAIAFGGRTQMAVGRKSAETDGIASSQLFLRSQLSKAILSTSQIASRSKLDASDEPPAADFSGSETRLTFTAPWLTHIGQGQLFRFDLHIQSGNLIIHWRPLGHKDGNGIEKGSELVGSRILLSGISHLSINYFGIAGQGIESGWQPRWSDSRTLPHLVQIKIDFVDNGPWPELVVVLAA